MAMAIVARSRSATNRFTVMMTVTGSPSEARMERARHRKWHCESSVVSKWFTPKRRDARATIAVLTEELA